MTTGCVLLKNMVGLLTIVRIIGDYFRCSYYWLRAMHVWDQDTKLLFRETAYTQLETVQCDKYDRFESLLHCVA